MSQTRPHLRHHAARRRAVARLQHEPRGEADARAPARAARRRRDRGRLPDRQRRRLRGGARDRAGDPRRRRSAASRARGPADIERAGRALEGAARPRIHTFIATSDIHLEHKLRMTPRAGARGGGARRAAGAPATATTSSSRAEDATRSDWSTIWSQVFAGRARRGRDVRSTSPTRSATRLPDEYGALIRHLATHVPRRRARRALGALPRRPRPRGREQPRGGARRRAAGRVHGQRHRRARRQHVAGRGRDGAPDAPRRLRRPRHRDPHRGDLPDEPAALVDHRRRGAAEQGDRRRQRLRARGGHPPGRRAEGRDHLRDHDAAVDRAAVERAGARQALRAPRLPRAPAASSASSSTATTSSAPSSASRTSPTRRRASTTRTSRRSSRTPGARPTSASSSSSSRCVSRHVRRCRRRPSSCWSTAASRKTTALGDGPVDAIFKAIAELTETKSELVRYQVNAITGGPRRAGRGRRDALRGRPSRDRPRRAHGHLVASAKAYVHALNKLEWHKTRHQAAEPKGI